MDWHPIQEGWGVEILLVTSCYRNWPDRLLGTLCRLDFHHLSCHLQNKCLCKMFYMKITLLSAFAHTKMNAGRGIYDSDDVSITTARSARSNNRYKKARKRDRVNSTWGKLVAFSLGKII